MLNLTLAFKTTSETFEKVLRWIIQSLLLFLVCKWRKEEDEQIIQEKCEVRGMQITVLRSETERCLKLEVTTLFSMQTVKTLDANYVTSV